MYFLFFVWSKSWNQSWRLHRRQFRLFEVRAFGWKRETHVRPWWYSLERKELLFMNQLQRMPTIPTNRFFFIKDAANGRGEGARSFPPCRQPTCVLYDPRTACFRSPTSPQFNHPNCVRVKPLAIWYRRRSSTPLSVVCCVSSSNKSNRNDRSKSTKI